MGLLDALRNVFRPQRDLVVRDPEAPLAVSEEARAHLRQLGPERGVHVDTVPIPRGLLPRATEGELQGPPPDALAGLPITVSDADLARLRGRTLSVRETPAGVRWVVEVPLEVRAKDTPNPDSRLYLTDQVLASGRPLFFVRGGELPDLPAILLEDPAIRSVLLREATLTVEREGEVAWEAIDQTVDTALRAWLGAGGRPLAGGADSVSRDPIEAEIQAVLEETVLPGIHRDGGDLTLLGVSNGVVKVSLQGACRSCPSSTATLRLGVERTLRQRFPGRVERVEAE